MRIIRLKLKAKTKLLLRTIAAQYRYEDSDFVEDLYGVIHFKGNGIPSQSITLRRAKQYSKVSGIGEIGATLLLSKRRMLLVSLVKLPYFGALVRLPSLGGTEKVSRLLTVLNALYQKKRQSQCVSCHLRAKCAFGKQYGSNMSDITKVVDSDFSQKAHQDCPYALEIQATNKLASAIDFLAQLTVMANKASLKIASSRFSKISKIANGANDTLDSKTSSDFMAAAGSSAQPVSSDEEDDDDSLTSDYVVPFNAGLTRDGGSRRSNFGTTFSGASVCQVTENFIEKVSIANLAIFNLGGKFSTALGNTPGADFKPVSHVSHDSDVEQMRSTNELNQVLTTQLALPSEIFDERLVKKELSVTKPQDPDEKRKLIYLLIDSSASMSGQLGGKSSHSLFTRASIAVLLSLAIARKARQEGGIVYFRLFEGIVGPLTKAENEDDFEHLTNRVSLSDFNGFSTNILGALSTAVEDITEKNSAEELASSEILIITDCEDQRRNTGSNEYALQAQKHPFHILDVSGKQFGVNLMLKEAAEKYFKADEEAPDVDSLVAQVF